MQECSKTLEHPVQTNEFGMGRNGTGMIELEANEREPIKRPGLYLSPPGRCTTGNLSRTSKFLFHLESRPRLRNACTS